MDRLTLARKSHIWGTEVYDHVGSITKVRGDVFYWG